MNNDHTPLYEIRNIPGDGPLPLIVHSAGWIDCGDAVVRVIETIRQQSEFEVIAEFDTNQLIDHRSHRPELTLTDGLNGDLKWPSIELVAGKSANGQRFMLLDGPEPDYNWRPFVNAVADLATRIGCTRIYSIGAYPAPVPHTRNIAVSHTASSPELLKNRKVSKGALTFPVGASLALADSLIQRGVEWLGYWSQVPYYTSNHQWPQSSLALLEALETDSGINFDLIALYNAAHDATSTLDTVVSEHDILPQILPQLEHRYDEMLELESTFDTGDNFEAALRQLLDEDNT